MVQVLAEAHRVATSVGREAAELLQNGVRGGFAIGTKSNVRDLVTEWDTRCEELILKRLEEAMPGIPVLAEESGQHGDASHSMCWVVDPIDGTVNFAHGIPMYAISIALEIDEVPVVGVVEAPAMGWTFVSVQGQGATMNGEPMQVSGTQTLEASVLASGFPYDRATTGHNFAQWEHFLRNAGACRRFGAAALDLCMVARGWLDGYWETRLSPWDLSAGALMVQEAGGTVTGITGDTFSSRRGHAVASNGAIHKEILAELAVVGAPKT